MIKNKDDLCLYISEDKKRNLGTKGHYLLKLFLGYDDAMAFKYLKCLRKYEYYLNCTHIRVFQFYYRFRLLRLGNRYGIRIGPNMVGYGFRIPHVVGGGIIVNCNSMGNYCSVNTDVVIGNKNGQDNRPTIGDNCSFSVGCKVIGKITIGNNVTVAPNSVVIKDVADNAIVSGVPATFLKWKEKI